MSGMVPSTGGGAEPYVLRFYLCFLDFETTGLDPRAGAEPIEVAALITDDRLEERGQFEALIRGTVLPPDWVPDAFEMHARSGLLDLVWSAGRPRVDVGADLADWLSRVIPAGATVHLAGNSVHFDRGFLAVYFPDIERRFHHRHLDVSSLRMAGELFTNAASIAGEKPHRAMADVLRCIAELHHWRNALRGGTGGCEHCDMASPDGQRFCSGGCQRCESTDFAGDGCAGLCGLGNY